MTYVTGDEVKRLAKDIIMTFLAQNAVRGRASQAEIFRACQLSWGAHPHSTENQQQFWLAGLMQVLRAEGLVARVHDRGPWQITDAGRNRYQDQSLIVENDARVSKLRALAVACVVTTMGMDADCARMAAGKAQRVVGVNSRLLWGDQTHATNNQQSFWIIGMLCFLAQHTLVEHGDGATFWRLSV